MPRSTSAPLVLALGVALVAGGIAFGLSMSLVGLVVLLAGLGRWVANLLPGRGHFHEEFVAPQQRAQPVLGTTGAVQRLAGGMPGYRVQLPVMVHPVSAGVKGGLLGGLVLPIPALIYGLASGHGIWYPVNLLAGMVIPGIGRMSVAELEHFSLTFLVLGLLIHVAMCLVAGLAYGVLLPTLPHIAKELAWGALLMPVLWTGLSFAGMSVLNPSFLRRLDWPSFIFAQFVFGVVAGSLVRGLRARGALRAGLLAGACGGACMVVPAAVWGWATGHGVWYPVNLLVGMILPKVAELPAADLQTFHADWFGYALAMHIPLSLAFGVALAILSPRLPEIPAAMSWGALLMPVLWTGASYSLMDVVNPALAQRVNWPWFVVSQFVFGVVASIVVVRTEQIALPPVGRGSTPA